MMRRLFLTIVLLLSSCPVWAQTDVTASIQQRVQHFQARYGIPLIYKSEDFAGSRVTFSAATEEGYGLLNDFLEFFEDEINKYPPEFFRDRQVRAIGLVTHLFKEDKPAEGMYSSDGRIMLFDFRRFADNKALKRHSIHHELFHMMALQTPGYRINDPEWSKLNQEGFVYGEQRRTWREVNPYNQGAPYLPGFVTDYAMMSVEEDKAEVFACLMQDQHKKLLMRWSQQDSIMRQKIEEIKNFVELYCSQMNTAYWDQGISQDNIQR